jgi:GDP-4-dehydro-6-deoxy-D-mannose reductase
MKKVLITGITGQVGSQMADFLLEKNENVEVFGLMRWQEPLDNLYQLTDRINKKDRISIKYGDLNDLSSLVKILEEVNPDFIFHLAAQSFPKTSFDIPIETMETNILGTAKLLEAVRISGNLKKNPIIHICSSSEVYGKSKDKGVFDETSVLHGASPYSISKIGTDFIGQFYAEAYGYKTFITRMGTHSGPRRSDVFFESTVAKQIALIENGLQEPKLFIGNLDSVRTYQDARDAIKAYWLLAESLNKDKFKPGEVFNIAGEEIFHLSEIVNILCGFSKVKNIKLVTDTERLRPLDADYQMFSCEKLKKTIDWKPEISVKQMLLDLLEHWRNEIKTNRIPLNR